ncbi:hypothetical protein [Streptosporangium sp. OZ121]
MGDRRAGMVPGLTRSVDAALWIDRATGRLLTGRSARAAWACG